MRPGSTLRRELRAELSRLGYTSVRFERFDWSGANRHEHRRIASACLRDQLVRRMRATHRADHFIIAHSHGGNVTLRAIQRSSYLSERVRGIVTIATPFLFFERERLFLVMIPRVLERALRWCDDLIGDHLTASQVILGLVGLYPFHLLFQKAKFEIGGWLATNCGSLVGDSYCSQLGMFLHAALGLLLVGVFLGSALKHGRRKALWEDGKQCAEEQRTIFRRHAYFQPHERVRAVPLLSLSSALDEALVALTGAWWVHRLGGLVAKGAVMMVIAGGAITVLAVLLAVWAIERHQGDHILYPLLDSFFGLLLLSAGWISIATSVAAVRWVGLASSATGAGLGLENFKGSLFWRVRALRSPPFPAKVEERRYLVRDLLRSRSVLFHSRVYSFLPAISDMGQWMAQIRGSFGAKGSTDPGA